MALQLYPVRSLDTGVQEVLQICGASINKNGMLSFPGEGTSKNVVHQNMNNGRYFTSINDVSYGGRRFLHVLSEGLSKFYLWESDEGQKYVKIYHLSEQIIKK